MNILVTGGAGYIGSHTTVELLNAGYRVISIDNLVNSSELVVDRIESITGKRPVFYQIDLTDTEQISDVFSKHDIDTVIHFAGLKAVGESTKQPLRYYRNNIDSTLSLLETMEDHNVRKLVFSSSATVYGDPGVSEYTEDLPVGQSISNPYGQSKYMIEQIIRDFSLSNINFHATLLRYFNPIGAHESGLIGEDPVGIPNNLMPFISQVASGKREHLSIFGNDYPTADGTCERDYIHVVDLAKGHISALENLKAGVSTYNLGSGKPTSVLQLIKAFEKTTGQRIPYSFAPRRPGDLAAFYANPARANRELNWKTTKTIEDMCHDAWNWQKHNPQGFNES